MLACVPVRPRETLSRSFFMTSHARRTVVLVLAAYYHPGYKAGGPIRTIRNLVASLGDEFDFRIVTSDRDYGDQQPFAGVGINAWNEVAGALVYYADAHAMRPLRLAQTVAAVAPDIVYLNSFFSPRFSISPLILRRLGWIDPKTAWIVAPRGELAPGAISIKSAKKRSYMAIARTTALHRGVLWQASSTHEANDIERAFGVPNKSIHVAPNLTAPVDPELPHGGSTSDRTRLSVCFLARVCEMKNLMFVIETVIRCNCDMDLHIYGPVEDQAYAQKCRSLISATDPRLTVTWHGEVPHEQVRSVLAKHDVFFLPTLGENFGHGIFESLAAGIPVLLSDRTPWRNLAEAGVGWDFPLDGHEAFVRAIESLASMAPDERHEMRHKAHHYAIRVAESSEAREANRRLFIAAPDSHQ
jgi:glycosyltransferase involved in cell wall biosynthesis